MVGLKCAGGITARDGHKAYIESKIWVEILERKGHPRKALLSYY